MAKTYVLIGATSGIGQQVAAKLAGPDTTLHVLGRRGDRADDTPLAESLLNQPAKRENAAQRHPLKRIGAPKDISDAVCFLLLDHSSWITGRGLAVDGGLSRIRLLT